jgi:hypothetical protein
MKPMSGMKPMAPMKAPERWWPEKLGEHPDSAGGQNEMRYAFFGDHKRLAVDMAMAKSNCMTPAIIAFPACSNTRAGADGR